VIATSVLANPQLRCDLLGVQLWITRTIFKQSTGGAMAKRDRLDFERTPTRCMLEIIQVVAEQSTSIEVALSSLCFFP
jgi:hypothetical protein